jgi:hypothetical protein
MKKILSIIGLAIALSACGGGGNDEAPASLAAEGFWTGAASTGNDVSLAILENGETWGVYSRGSVIVGALYGQTTTSGSTLSGSGRDFNIPSRTVTQATYTGNFVAKTSVSVVTAGAGSFAGAYDADYDAVPSLAALAGTFNETGLSGFSNVQSAPVTISPTGTVSVASSLGCSASGTAVPRPGGKNIFNVSVTFNGSNCALGNGATTTGVAYYDVLTRQLLVMALNSGKTDGFIYTGAK